MSFAQIAWRFGYATRDACSGLPLGVAQQHALGRIREEEWNRSWRNTKGLLKIALITRYNEKDKNWWPTMIDRRRDAEEAKRGGFAFDLALDQSGMRVAKTASS